MSDRLPRPPVRLKASLPDGNLSGLGVVAADLLGDDPGDVYALVRLVPTEIKEDLENDHVRTAVLRIGALEPLIDGKLPADVVGSEAAGEVLTRLRAERTGQNVLPYGEVDFEKVDDLRRQLADWREAHQVASDVDMAAAWRGYFGDDAGSFLDATGQQLREFLAAKREAADAASGDDGPGGPGPESFRGSPACASPGCLLPESHHGAGTDHDFVLLTDSEPVGEQPPTVPGVAFSEDERPAPADTRRRGRGKSTLAAVPDQP